MVKIPSKFIERIKDQVPKHKRNLKNARDQDKCEADTVDIVREMLCEVFGFNRNTEITCEYAVSGDRCDLAVKLGEEVKYLVEVKKVKLELTDSHREQLKKYCTHNGASWGVLTNGMSWEIHRITFRQRPERELICSFNFPDLDVRAVRDQTHLFLLCKEGVSKGGIDEFYKHLKVANRYVVAALIQNDPAVRKVLRKGLKQYFSSGLKISMEDIRSLFDDVLNSEVMEHDQTKKAASKIKNALKQAEQESAKPASVELTSTPQFTSATRGMSGGAVGPQTKSVDSAPSVVPARSSAFPNGG